MKAYPFDNLVFKGGGVLGIAYLGSMKALDEAGFLPGIKRVSGASAGAITALVTSFKLNASQMKSIADSLDFSKVPEKENIKHDLFSKLFNSKDLPFDDVYCINRLFHKYGWYSSNYFYKWLMQMIQDQFDKVDGLDDKIKNKKGQQTFSDFQKAGFSDLYISVTNVTKHRNEIFSVETKPDFEVAKAVRMSMSIPLFFETIEQDGDHYADGGTVNNYPIEVFDNEAYVDDPAFFTDQINMKTLGCHLFTPSNHSEKTPKKDNLIHYIENLFETLLQVQTIDFENSQNIKDRSVNINDHGISAVDFDIVVDKGDPLTKRENPLDYDKLYITGYDSMKTYLNNHSSIIQKYMSLVDQH